MTKQEEAQKEDLEMAQRSVEEAAKKVAHTTKSDRLKEVKRTEEVTAKEGAAARSTRPTEKKVLRKQARNARPDHACCEMQLVVWENTETEALD